MRIDNAEVSGALDAILKNTFSTLRNFFFLPCPLEQFERGFKLTRKEVA
jgi:hypothetical protein